MCCFYFFLWCIPDNAVHTGGFLAIVFRHSSNGENLAAIRAGEQTLQGFHLVPSTNLRCLHDTDLESTNVAVDDLPVNGIPFCASRETAPTVCTVVICFAPRVDLPSYLV